MLANFDLNHLLTFPLKESEDRKHFLIGVLVYLAGFIIPIIPTILITGYVVRLMRQVLEGEQPRMLPWDRWEEMLVDGLRLFGAQMVFMLPFFLILFPLMGLSFVFPFLAENANHNSDWLFALFPLLMGGSFLILMPLMILVGIFLPAAQVHVAAKREFAAAFRVREWWPIFRANVGGFLLALGISYGLTFALSIILQITMFTIVLTCLLPFLIPLSGMYVMLILYPTYAQAYKAGLDRLDAQLVATAG